MELQFHGNAGLGQHAVQVAEEVFDKFDEVRGRDPA